MNPLITLIIRILNLVNLVLLNNNVGISYIITLSFTCVLTVLHIMHTIATRKIITIYWARMLYLITINLMTVLTIVILIVSLIKYTDIFNVTTTSNYTNFLNVAIVFSIIFIDTPDIFLDAYVELKKQPDLIDLITDNTPLLPQNTQSNQPTQQEVMIEENRQ